MSWRDVARGDWLRDTALPVVVYGLMVKAGAVVFVVNDPAPPADWPEPSIHWDLTGMFDARRAP